MKLVAEGLACQRGGRTIFRDLSFSLVSGDSLLLRGPNGSGKTTLLRALAGFIPLFKGTWRLDGADTETDTETDTGAEITELAHYVGHLNGVKHTLTAHENLAFWQRYLAGATDEPAIADTLGTFGLASLRDVPAGLMSQGQKRRLGLARLLIAKRPIWILDEPTVSLDAQSQDVLAGHIAAQAEQGGIVIAATHIPLGLDFTHVLELKPGRAAA